MKRKITQESIAAQRKLQAAWYAAKARRGRDLNQAVFGDKFGWSQSVVTQYLNGRIPLNLTALLRFCEELEVSPEDIYPELAKQIPKDEACIDEKIQELLNRIPDDSKESILHLLNSLSEGIQKDKKES